MHAAKLIDFQIINSDTLKIYHKTYIDDINNHIIQFTHDLASMNMDYIMNITASSEVCF